MLPKEARTRPYPSQELIGHLAGSRGKAYFPHCTSVKERYKECEQAILDPMKGIIVPDKREKKASTHVCLFINGAGENIALPLSIDNEGKISVLTIKNISENEQNPSWFYEEYSKIAKMRNISAMDRIWRPK